MQKIISLIMIWVMIFSLVSCAASESKNPSETGTDGKNGGALVVNGVEVQDAFVTLQVDSLVENDVSVAEIEVEDILVNSVTVEGITVLEVEVVPLNDEFVYLAYQNFVSYYGDNIDFQKFLTDVAIGGACIIVYVTLSAAGGPIGTFFGAVITSEFTAASVVIGAAIDAAVSGYQAYQEGGDAAYIVGHMLNGVAEGFKWSAILAPVSGSLGGIRSVGAVNAIKKLDGLANLSDKEIEALLKDYSKIIKAVNEADLKKTDLRKLKKLYKKMSGAGELSEGTTEDLFISAVRNQDTITDCVQRYNLINVIATNEKDVEVLHTDIAEVQQKQWLSKHGFPESELKEINNKVKKAKTLEDVEYILRRIVKNYDNSNRIARYEFLQLFGEELSDKVCEDILQKKFGEEVINAIKKCIIQPNAYSKLCGELGDRTCMKLLSDAESLLVLKKRFESKNIDRLLEIRRWHQCMDISYIELRLWKNRETIVKANIVEEIYEGFCTGKYKTLEDVKKVSAVVADNLQKNVNEFYELLKKNGLLDKNKVFLNDLACCYLKEQLKGVDENLREALVNNILSKNEIQEMYGREAYDKLVEKFSQVVQCLTAQNPVINSELIKELFVDSLRREGIKEESIIRILNGVPASAWGVSDSEIEKINHLVAVYYLKTDKKCFSNFFDTVLEKKVQEGNVPKEAAEQIKYIMENGGMSSDGYIGGGIYKNHEGLPEGEYKEYDIYPYRGASSEEHLDRGVKRIVIGADGHVYYTKDHYTSFIQII